MSKRMLISMSWILLVIVACGSFLLPRRSLACTVSCTGTEFGIATDPPDSFLTMSNMAPGDHVSSSLTVKNTGDHDFGYTLSSSLQSGDTGFYDSLLLDIADSSGYLLYSGSLKDVAGLDMGKIPAHCQEVLVFTVTFPADSGNELQKKNASVSFVFSAVSQDSTQCSGAIFEEPTINKNFKLKVGSTDPIKFHLTKPDYSLDYQEHPDAILTVSGPDPQGNPATYTFSLGDGTLRFDTSEGHPHYIADFDTNIYPVQPLGTYTARVTENGTDLGSISFQAGDTPGISRSNSP